MGAAFAVLLSNGLDGTGEALRIVVNESSKIERVHFFIARPHERITKRTDYANGFKPKSVMTRVDELTFAVLRVRDGSFYYSVLGFAAFDLPHGQRFRLHNTN
jgi:putative transposase